LMSASASVRVSSTVIFAGGGAFAMLPNRGEPVNVPLRPGPFRARRLRSLRARVVAFPAAKGNPRRNFRTAEG
jgi:hypothetical protein